MAEFEETSATPGSSGEPEQAIGTCTFFKRATKNKNLRKRVLEEEDDDNSSSVSVQKAQKPKNIRGSDGHLEFSSRSTMALQRLASTQGSESAEDLKAGSFFYESSREIQTQTDSRATATLETETEFDRDARALRERVLKQADEALKRKEPTDEKLYKGIHGYTDHKAGFRREHTIAGEKAGGAHGPLRASSHIRWSVRFDYQPDICKDYKETGYCGYGDACKFMHDRGDYKSGWQMEREWEETEKKRKEKIARGLLDEEESHEEDEDSDDLPFACFICRQNFKDPVVTACKHYFCERCALKHHAGNKNCFVCNKPTNGVFNAAHEIIRKLGEDKGGVGKKQSTR